MNNEIKEILEKPNVYSFADETYLYFGDYNKLKYYITNLQKENERLKNDVEDISCSHFSLFKSYEDYKSRCEKAIEYNNQIIKDTKDFYRPTSDIIYSGDALIEIATNNINILQNGSEEK